eukprot:3570762-Karenia_brevis.AAC.1
MHTTQGAKGWRLKPSSLNVVKRLVLHPGGPEMSPYISALHEYIIGFPGIPPGGGVAKRGSVLCPRSP